jgi:hypothetical protein
MSPSLPVRTLLLVSGPASWVPAKRVTLENCVLQVEQVESLADVRAATPVVDWDVVAFRVECLRPLTPDEALGALRKIAPEATFLPVTDEPDPREALI